MVGGISLVGPPNDEAAVSTPEAKSPPTQRSVGGATVSSASISPQSRLTL